jgi:hypothetical protein
MELRDKEERDAWVAFAAGLASVDVIGLGWVTSQADKLLEEFRKRRPNVGCVRGTPGCNGVHQITPMDPVGRCVVRP